MDRAPRPLLRPSPLWRLLVLVLVVAAAPGWALGSGEPPLAVPAAGAPPAPTLQAPQPGPPGELTNARDPLPGIRTGGLPPGAEVYARLAGEGFVTLIDLRPEPELAAAARAGAEAAGMSYVQIPVASDADLDLGSARALDAVLDDPARSPLVVACASGNRSGALLAVRAFWLDGKPAEEALALGKAAGLTKLEPSVRQLLGLPALAPAAPAN